MSRPLQSASIETLTLHAERNRSDRAELELVKAELCYRSTKAAARLREQIDLWLYASDLFANDNQRSGREPEDKNMDSGNVEPAANQKSNWTHSAVNKQRAKLIDLSRRSPLIAFKHSPRSASQLRFVDERTDLLFTNLTNGSLGFEPLPDEHATPADETTPAFGLAYERARLTDEIYLAATERLSDDQDDASAWQVAERELRARVRSALGLPPLDYGKKLDIVAIAKAHGFDTSYDLKDSDDGPVLDHHDDDRIRILLTRKESDRRLKSINDRATSHLRETGHHTLHLVFGFVQWFEDEHSEVVSHAPLLILPVELHKDRSRAKNEYRLKSWEGGLEVNVSLIEKAREHWSLQLPPLRDGETPESYFVRVNAVLKQGQRLSLRRFATLTVLPPMTLWRDLDPEAWPDGAFEDHRLLPGLLSAEEIPTVDGDDTIIDIDDPKNASRVPALITDADASQHRAIMDMASGKDMSIEGPPGTGKSQTITNMIATALSQGKRVLFVAEKQAALRVVSDRLRAAGFGPLLLELHGDKASRTDVYQGIRERLASRPRKNSDALQEKRAELVRHRNLLRRYLSLVRAPLGGLGKTAYELLWRQIRLKNSLNEAQLSALAARWIPAKADELDLSTLSEHKELLSQFSAALTRVTDARSETTKWVHAEKMDPFDQQPALQSARAASDAAQLLESIAAKVSGLGFNFPRADEDLGRRLITRCTRYVCR